LTPDKTNIIQFIKKEFFLQQVSEKQGGKLEFSDLLFQPVPYSEGTPKRMPPEFEQYYYSDEYVIVNVPLKFMFKAKMFNPSRFWAVYQKNISH